MTNPPFVDLAFAPARVDTRSAGDGSLVLSSPQPLERPLDSLGTMLRHWATAAPDRPFLAERAGEDGSWRTMTYADVHHAVRSLGQAMLERGLDPDHPVMLLSGNAE